MGSKSSKSKFEDEYIQGNMVGKGAFASVYRCTWKGDAAKVFAAKVMSKEHLSRKQMRESKDEVDIMKRLDHPNVVRLFAVFETQKKLTLVMEFCSGGQLLKRIVK